MKKSLIILVSLFLVPGFLAAQEWVVPTDKAAQLSPFRFDESSEKAGSDIYRLNCASCHGTPGKANYAALVPIPGDPATDKIQNNSDGALHYKISEGRVLMPAFKNILSARDIWSVISFLRTFKQGYIQSVAEARESTGAYFGATMQFAFDSAAGKVAVEVKDRNSNPLANAGVTLFAARTFGMLPLSSEIISDKEGKAWFDMSEKIPGDKEGNIKLIAKLTVAEGEDMIIADTVMAVGEMINIPGLTEKRAMWNIGRKAPVWLIALYAGGALLTWGFIFYILFGLRTIWNEGEKEELEEIKI